MGNINVIIDDELDDEFRDAAFTYRGKKKGYLTNALQEAIRLWLDYVKKEGQQRAQEQRQQQKKK